MLSFSLPDDFVERYGREKVKWGFPDGGGNSLGEITFYRTYSRLWCAPCKNLKIDRDRNCTECGKSTTKERWHDTCRRVVEGMYSILKDHCRQNRLPWNDNKGQRSAQEAYDRLFNFKWTPPGRGLWMMGTPFVHEGPHGEGPNSAGLQNCAFVSTRDITKLHPERPFTFLMEASMLGIGVGFDTDGAKKELRIQVPTEDREGFEIQDTRESWVESVGAMLRAFLVPGQPLPYFDYSKIRPAGEPIVGFGGTAAGPGPLIELHNKLGDQFLHRGDELFTSKDIVDVANLIGKCVVSGNVRRSAEIALGDPDDKVFLNLKNWESYPERMDADDGWGWVSNNTVRVTVGENYDPLAELSMQNGEPGYVWMDIARRYGRLEDPPNDKDYRAVGFNPCVEQTLESFECCTLVETFPPNCEDRADFLRTLKYSYMYAKAVTLVPTHWPETNAVMQRNRRIGSSLSGMAQFVERHNWTTLREYENEGYGEVQRWDNIYSEWLGVRESIKTTSVKPSGSVSLLAGVTPGAHWPVHDSYIRRIRFGKDDPLVAELVRAGYVSEPAKGNLKTSVVVEIPVHGQGVRTQSEVSIFEKVQLAVMAQRFWADNSVSLTVSFLPEEAHQIPNVLRMFEGQLKSISFLPIMDGAFAQMPYEAISEEDYEELSAGKKRLNWKQLYEGKHLAEPVGEAYCSTDVCEVPTR